MLNSPDLCNKIKNLKKKKFWPDGDEIINNYPKKDVFGRVKASCEDAGGEGRSALADHSAGEAGDGALRDGSLLSLLTPRHRVRHHKVYGALCGAANLWNNRKCRNLTHLERDSVLRLNLNLNHNSLCFNC